SIFGSATFTTDSSTNAIVDPSTAATSTQVRRAVHAGTLGEARIAAWSHGRIFGLPMASRAARSARALQPLGDATDAREQRREQLAVLTAARAPALQQVHLHEVHGIEVGVAQPDRALHGRIEVEQRAAVADGEHLRARALVFGAQLQGI